MEQDHEASGIDVSVVAARPDDDAAIEAAISLGNASRSTLGHMPFAAYHAAASKGCLALAKVGGRVAGYALFDLARSRVRLSHLCVDATFRGRGIARLLIEYIRGQHSDRLGILARCRHDYGLGEMWIRLGFSQLSEKPGRSKEGYPVVSWWLDHGHPNRSPASRRLLWCRPRSTSTSFVTSSTPAGPMQTSPEPYELTTSPISSNSYAPRPWMPRSTT